MSAIDNVVHVTISILNVGVTRAGFGTAMGLGVQMATPLDRVAYYDQSAGPGDVGDGGNPMQDAYEAYFAPSPKPTTFALGRIKINLFSFLLGGALNAGEYGFTLNWKFDEGTEQSVDILYDAAYEDEDEILDGLALAVNAADCPFAAGAVGDKRYLGFSVTPEDGEYPLVGASTFLVPGTEEWFALPYNSMITVTGGDAAVKVDHEYVVEINDTEYSFTTTAAPTQDELIEGWEGVVEADAPDDFFVIAIGGESPALIVCNLPSCCRLDIDFTNEESELAYSNNFAETIAEAFDACRLASADWYALGLVDRTKVNQASAADKAELETTIFGYASANKAQINTDGGGISIGAYCFGQAFTRTFGGYHPQATGYVNEDDSTDALNENWTEFRWLGARLTVNLDTSTATWKFATFTGNTVALTATQKNRLFGNPIANNGVIGGLKMNLFDNIGGRGIMREGCVHSGEWIDTIIGVDWLTARMQEDVFVALAASLKVPYTDDGIAVIVNQIIARLQIAQGTGFLAFDEDLGKQLGFLITYPSRSDVSASMRAARILQNIKWSAGLAGAIHLVKIEGTVSA